jgi:hypothetical protein
VVENRNTMYQITPSSRNWGVMPLDRLKCPGPMCKTRRASHMAPVPLYKSRRANRLLASNVAATLHPVKISALATNFLTARGARSRLPKQGFRVIDPRGGV